MIIIIAGWFDVYDKHGHKTYEKEYVASHGIDSATGKTIIVPAEHPEKLGAAMDRDLNEWVIS